MAKNRVIYQSESVFAGPSPATGFHVGHQGAANHPITGKDAVTTPAIGKSLVKQLQRIQSANYSFNITRQDLNQFGELAAIDRVILESPTVSMDINYVLGDMTNEKRLGFHIVPSGGGTTNLHSALSGILKKETDERNYFIKTLAEGVDALGDDPTFAGTAKKANVIGIGNAFLTSYTQDSAVGDFPTASVSVEGLNMSFDKGVSGNFLPAVTPSDGTKESTRKYALPSGQSNNITSGNTALRPGDITLSFNPATAAAGVQDIAGLDVQDAKIQSYSLSFDLAREPLQKLGSKFAFAREITFPVTVTMTVDANVGELATGNLADVIDNDASYDLYVNMKEPGHAGAGNYMTYALKNAKLDSQEYSSDIGSNKSVSLTFTSQIGGAAQTDRGLFMSGRHDV
tara:strand:- start:1173 stop:2372 length:1200 start_codon:yes stop_codon:yes gene_type:complete